MISTETDAQGHYRLDRAAQGGIGHKLAVYPPLDRPTSSPNGSRSPPDPGFEPVKFDIALKRGIWITGKVTDVVTGKPVAAAVDYFPLLTNAHAKDYRNFDAQITTSIAIKTRYKTDKEAASASSAFPATAWSRPTPTTSRTGSASGPSRSRARSTAGQLLTYDRIFPRSTRALKPVNVPEEATSFACDLGLDPGESVRVHLVDTSGAAGDERHDLGPHPEPARQRRPQPLRTRAWRGSAGSCRASRGRS